LFIRNEFPFVYQKSCFRTKAIIRLNQDDDISNENDAAKFVSLFLLSLFYMFRATVSPIFRSTLYIELSGTIYRLCFLLLTGGTDWMLLLLLLLLLLFQSVSTAASRQQSQYIVPESCIYKVLRKMGETVSRNM